MKFVSLIVLGLQLSGCGDDDVCRNPAAVIISIDSIPLTNPVTGDLIVFGHTKIPNDVTTSGVRLGVRGAFSNPSNGTVEATSGSGDGFATWTGTVPLAVLLAPNDGPGTIVVEVIPETNCAEGQVSSSLSEPMEVAYPPDAAIDTPPDSSGS